MEQTELEQDVELMPYNQEVNPPTSPDLEVDQVLCDQGDTQILGDNMEVEMHNISFDVSQHRVVQSCRVFTLDINKSHVEFEERVVISDVHNHPAALNDATRAYAEATISSVRFLIAENKKMVKELQTDKK